MKVALYARASTEDQETDNQLLALREFAPRRGLEVVAVYQGADGLEGWPPEGTGPPFSKMPAWGGLGWYSYGPWTALAGRVPWPSSPWSTA